MPKAKPNRKQLFRVALALAGETQGSWAEANDLTPQHLSLVLNGKRDSLTLNARIDGYIAEKLGKRAIALAS
jgi:hypothetical protein